MFDNLPPMFPTLPTCQIQWIDKQGELTPDHNHAVGLACSHIRGAARRFPICAEHAARMPEAPGYVDGVRYSFWTFESY